MLIQFIGFQNATILAVRGHKPLELATETPRFA
jgi:hypothetical protein